MDNCIAKLSIRQVFPVGFWAAGAEYTIGLLCMAHLFEVKQPTHDVCSARRLKGKPGNQHNAVSVHSSHPSPSVQQYW